jgi:hypothetical protein
MSPRRSRGVAALRGKVTLLAKKALAPILYRHRPIGLSAGKLRLYLDAIHRTRELSGAVVEIGCNVCGTSSLGRQMLRKQGSDRRYVCVDTFAGFVEEQHADDVERGNPGSKAGAFGASDIHLARRVLKLHGAADVELIEADICRLDPEELPVEISVVAVSLKNYQPIYAALEKIWPRMSPGGVVLVDDCGEGAATWRAGEAFEAFTAERGIERRIEFGMGRIEVA